MTTHSLSFQLVVQRTVLILLAVLLLPFSCLAQDAASEKPATLENLIGRWLRMDGGYILEIKSIAKDGDLDAAYLNPNPIHVETAKATTDEKGIDVVVVLQDTGYPGATYRLHYDAKGDKLVGTYFQPAVKQTYEIEFVRTKE